MAHQMKLPSGNPPINVNKLQDSNHPDDIQFIGEATSYLDGTVTCLANVGGLLCLVEVKIKTE